MPTSMNLKQYGGCFDVLMRSRRYPVAARRHFPFFTIRARRQHRLRPPKMSNPEHFNQDGHVLMLHSPTGKLIPVPFDPRRDVADAVSPNAANTPPDELTCKYKGSLCLQPRVRKRNGELHNLCALHRERANANQGRFDSKLKQRRQQNQDDDDNVDASALPEPIQNSGSSLTPPINEWEADLLLKTIQDSG